MSGPAEPPLDGVRVAVTRPRHQASELADALRREGATPLEYPAIRLAPPRDRAPLLGAAADLERFDWLVFTSANGVEHFAAALAVAGVQPSAATRVACVGPGTAAAALRAGFPPGLTAARHLSEGLVETLKAAGSLEGRSVLLPRSEAGRDVLPEALAALGAEVTDVPAYRPEADHGSLSRLGLLVRDGSVEVVTFTSSSAASAYAASVGPGGVTFACIGPVTAGTARERKLVPIVTAAEHTVEGLVAALVRWRAGTAR